MPTLNLKNITIKKLEDRNFKPYFLIVNNDNSDENGVSEKQTFFCFEWTLKEGWTDLVNNWEQIKEVELEFEEREHNSKTYRKVTSLYTEQTDNIIV